MKVNIESIASRMFMLFVAVLVATIVAAPVLGEVELTAKKRKAIVARISEVLNEHYFKVDVAKQMGDFIQNALENGDYENIIRLPDFCYRLTKNLRSVSNDLHLRVYPYQGGPVEKGEPDEGAYISRGLPTWKKANFGFRKLELMDGNIGYIELHGFYLARVAGPTAIAAMNFLANCDALVIDLRNDSGGQPSMIRLLSSYFLEKRTNLGSLYRRHGEIVDQSWTADYVQGPRLTDQPIYILVSEHTFSAAEAFAYNLQSLGRATIIGETTRGGANPTASHDFPDESITVDVPYGEVINPITKGNFEGTGVVPNIQVPATDALDIARIEALQVLIDKEENDETKVAFRMMVEEAEARLNPVILEEEALLPFTGSYERGIKATIENGFLNVLGYILIPMGNDKFMIENGDEQIQFSRDADGKISGFVVMFRDGGSQPFKRLEE